jgi:hypothetical protein
MILLVGARSAGLWSAWVRSAGLGRCPASLWGCCGGTVVVLGAVALVLEGRWSADALDFALAALMAACTLRVWLAFSGRTDASLS